MTAIPRWTLDPVVGVAESTTPLPHELWPAVRALAEELAVPPGAVLLAAHAKVLTALSGEPDVTTGYVAGSGRRPLPCRLTTDTDSWRTLLQAAARAESALLSHRNIELEALRRELGHVGPAFETEFDPTDGPSAEGLAATTVLRVGVAAAGGHLWLRYRTEAIDAACATRIAGYHLAALRLMIANPDADHAQQSLLAPDELRFQLEGLAGPHRELPDQRVHEFFEQQVRTHPEAIAVVHGDRRWTYRELNRRANQLARALLSRGLDREDVVAVVTERNLDWLAAVLAVFKAGGAYLPIEPHFPADRIAKTLTRARCRLVLTERGSTATLAEALDPLPGVRTLFIDTLFIDTLFIDDAYAEGHPDDDLGLAVARRPTRLHLLHLRLHRGAERCDVRTRRDGQPPLREDR